MGHIYSNKYCTVFCKALMLYLISHQKFPYSFHLCVYIHFRFQKLSRSPCELVGSLVDQLAVDQPHPVAGTPAVAPGSSLCRQGHFLCVSTFEARDTAVCAVHENARLTSTVTTGLDPRTPAPGWTECV